MTNKSTKAIDLDTLPLLISTSLAAAILGAHVQTIRKMCSRGEIKASKVGTDWRINTAAFREQFGI